LSEIEKILNKSEKNALLKLIDIFNLENERYEINDDGHVTKLDLSNKKIKSIPSIIREFPYLKSLELDQNEITHITGLENLTRLKELNLGQNQITKIEGLDNLTQLTELNLSQNQIIKIEGLNKLSQLQFLFMGNNEIRKIEGLDDLSDLRELYLASNEISKIEGLDNLSKLYHLSLASNKIKEVTGLENLTRLLHLDLENNQIKTIEVGLENLTKLSMLIIRKNPLSARYRAFVKKSSHRLAKEAVNYCRWNKRIKGEPKRKRAEEMGKTEDALKEFEKRQQQIKTLETLKKLTKVATSIKTSILQKILKMDDATFTKNISNWADTFKFTIDKDMIIFNKETISDFIGQLESQFDFWEDKEKSKNGKI